MSDTSPPTALVPVEPKPFDDGEIKVQKSPGESAILEAIERLDRKLTTHGEHIDTHRVRLDKHDSLLQSHTNQLMSHAAMLTEHAKLHTDHARGIIAAQENARLARQSSSDLAKESKAFADALGVHMARSEKSTAEKLDALVADAAKASLQRSKNGEALDKLVSAGAAAVDSKPLRMALLVGASVGVAVAELVYRLFFATH